MVVRSPSYPHHLVVRSPSYPHQKVVRSPCYPRYPRQKVVLIKPTLYIYMKNSKNVQVIFYIIFSIFWASSSHCVNSHSVFPPWELNLNSVGTVYCTPGVESSITIYLLTLTKCHLSPQEKAQNMTVKLLYWSVAGCCSFHNCQPQTSDDVDSLHWCMFDSESVHLHMRKNNDLSAAIDTALNTRKKLPLKLTIILMLHIIC